MSFIGVSGSFHHLPTTLTTRQPSLSVHTMASVGVGRSTVGQLEGLQYLKHHLVLPPKLPQIDDTDLDYEHYLLCFVQETAELYLDPSKSHWAQVCSMLRTLRDCYPAGLSNDALKQRLMNFLPHGMFLDPCHRKPVSGKRSVFEILLLKPCPSRSHHLLHGRYIG